MRPDARRNQEITRRAAPKSGLAFASQANLLLRIGSWWDVDPDRILSRYAPAAAAGWTGIAR
jgi:hypothetical protein